MRTRAVIFTGIRLENPFLLSSAPPTESETNILRAFDAGWGGVVIKTIGMHPISNVVGARTKFFRTTPDDNNVSMKKRPGAALHGSWNWELVSDRPLDWWVPRIRRMKQAYPTRVIIASIIAGSNSDMELRHWQMLAEECQDAGADGLECNLSGRHVERRAAGPNADAEEVIRSVVIEAVKEVTRVPVWAKLAPTTLDVVTEAAACFRAGADAVVSSNTFPSLPLIDPETLEFEINVDGLISTGGLGGPAILPMSLATMARMCQAFPERAFSAVGGISDFSQALSYFLLGAGTVQVCTAAMLDQAVGPNVIRRLNVGLDTFLARHADLGWNGVEDFRGIRRNRVVAQSQIRRPDGDPHPSGHVEGYATPEAGVRA